MSIQRTSGGLIECSEVSLSDSLLLNCLFAQPSDETTILSVERDLHQEALKALLPSERGGLEIW